jgi:hypothetical protein
MILSAIVGTVMAVTMALMTAMTAMTTMPAMITMTAMIAMTMTAVTVTFGLLFCDLQDVVGTEICEHSSRDYTLHARDNLRTIVERADPTEDLRRVLGADDIKLIEQDPVCEGNLPMALLIIFAASAFTEASKNGLRIHEGDCTVEPEVARNVGSLPERPDNWNRVSHASRLD